MDFTRMRVTQLICNKLTYMPDAAPDREEVLIRAERIALIDTWDLYVKENCHNGSHRGANNLTRQEELGRKEIQNGIEEKNWKLYGTDKSGKLELDT